MEAYGAQLASTIDAENVSGFDFIGYSLNIDKCRAADGFWGQPLSAAQIECETRSNRCQKRQLPNHVFVPGDFSLV